MNIYEQIIDDRFGKGTTTTIQNSLELTLTTFFVFEGLTVYVQPYRVFVTSSRDYKARSFGFYLFPWKEALAVMASFSDLGEAFCFRHSVNGALKPKNYLLPTRKNK